MDFAQQLKSTVDIVDVVRTYVVLKKVGTRYVGLCPFHSEKSPSFNVNPVHGFYKCFGCGEGGDLIKFVEKIEGVSFMEALQLLADRYGLTMPKRREDQDEQATVRQAILRLHELASLHFQHALSSPEGAAARAYLQRRGLDARAVDHFQLGYSPRQGSALVRLFEREGYQPEQWKDAGLVLPRQDGSGWFDRFRNRLMFPIHNESGKVIGFGGRSLDEGDEPKYLNSSETPIYKKSSVLYNLHRAKESMRKNNRVVLVEGYMDAIGVSTAGIAETVAPCGTALTAQQVAIMRRLAETVVINFDPDNAGMNATERSLPVLLDGGMKVRILTLPGGLDPDEFVKEHGDEVYRERLAQAPTYFSWLAERARKRFDLGSPEGKVDALRFLVDAASKVPGKLERTMVVTEMANSLGLDPNLLLQRMRVNSPTARSRSGEIPPAADRTPIGKLNERMLLQILLQVKEARDHLLPVLQQSPVYPELRLRHLFEILRRLDDEAEGDWTRLRSEMAADEQTLMEQLMFTDAPADELPVSVQNAISCIQHLEAELQDRAKERLREQIRGAERAGDMAQALELMESLKQFERRLRRPA